MKRAEMTSRHFNEEQPAKTDKISDQSLSLATQCASVMTSGDKKASQTPSGAKEDGKHIISPI